MPQELEERDGALEFVEASGDNDMSYEEPAEVHSRVEEDIDEDWLDHMMEYDD